MLRLEVGEDYVYGYDMAIWIIAMAIWIIAMIWCLMYAYGYDMASYIYGLIWHRDNGIKLMAYIKDGDKENGGSVC
jgi:hypothetical protein